jgi:hypothetical protein
MFFLFLIIKKKKKNIIKFLKLNNLGKALFVYIKKLAKGKIGMEKK